MPDQSYSIPQDRVLTTEERTLVRWLLEHGNTTSDSLSFLRQLDHIRVISRCPCGCASIDFAVAGQAPAPSAPMKILSDYQWDDPSGARCGVFVFAKADLLAGLEVWSIDGLKTPDELPQLQDLKPIEWIKS